MKVKALTMVFDEELILPYFLSHYRHLDEIVVLYETDTQDGSLDLLHHAENVSVVPVHVTGGIDDLQKVALINEWIGRIGADWLYVLDSDEFIFPEDGSRDHDFLSKVEGDVLLAMMYQVYRHKYDKDLDPTKPPVPQRLHGDPDRFSRVQTPTRDCNVHYCKPIVLRPKAGIRFSPGNHIMHQDAGMDYQISNQTFSGVHWQMADPTLALYRRMRRKARISEVNKRNGYGFQHWNVTEKGILDECQKHLDDPIIPELQILFGN